MGAPATSITGFATLVMKCPAQKQINTVMKINDIITETTAGAIATVAHPLGKMQKRNPSVSPKKKKTSERKLSKSEIRKRDQYADDLPDAEFKKRYGKDWEAVKYGTATNMAKKK